MTTSGIQGTTDRGYECRDRATAWLHRIWPSPLHAHLRAEHRRSPRAAADAEHALAKAALLRIRIEEKQRALVRRADVDALIDHRADAPVKPACALRAAW